MKKIIDLTGQRFDRWLVFEQAGRNKYGKILWKCRCNCGTIKIISGNSLKMAHSRSCGCLRRERIDITDQRFGRLLVIEEEGRSNNGHILWKCVCDCGNETVVCSGSLKSGDTKSCGCLAKELASQRMDTFKRTGKNNPMFGKRGYWAGKNRPEVSERMKGENNPMFGVRGDRHPRYNPNLTDEERQQGRVYPEYYEWRNIVFRRDNFTCQRCGKCGGNLCAHHLNGYDNFPELRTTPKNGITLCEKCHRNFHHKYGYCNNSKQQFEEFLYTNSRIG